MSIDWKRLSFIAVLAALALGFAPETPLTPMTPEAVLAQDGEGEEEDLAKREYKLVVGDTIEIVVFSQGDMSGTIQVPPGGKITFNPIGLLKLVDKSLQDLEVEIKTKLLEQDILKDPKVQIHVVAYAPREVFLAGAITGKIDLPVYKNRRLLQVIAMAGGWGSGDKRRVRILRSRPGGNPYSIPIDAESILANEEWSKNIIIKPEDIIYVPSFESSGDFRWVYVLGKVGRPGPVPYMRGREPITLMKLIVIAGDFTEYANSSEVRIIRKTKGRPRLIEVDFDEILEGERDDVVLEPDDLVFIPESIF